MEGNLSKKDTFTVEYRFAKDLVKAVIELRTSYVASLSNFQQDDKFLTDARRSKVEKMFKKEQPQLDEQIRRFTSRDGRLNYDDEKFLRLVVKFIAEYKPELKSEEEFLLVCTRIAYVTACFMRNNEQSDALNIAVHRVFEILIDTFYPNMINNNGPIMKDISDSKYRFAYDLVKTLIKMRDIHVPDLELPNSDNCLFTWDLRNKVKEFFSKKWYILDEQIISFTCSSGTFDYSDEIFSLCMVKFEDYYGSGQKTKEEFVLACASIAYAAGSFLRKNLKSNAFDLAVDRIHQMVKRTIYFNKYEQDDDYRFSCDLMTAIVEMKSNPVSVSKVPYSSNSFFMIAHRNKIEDFLSRERLSLVEVVKKYINKDESSEYNDNQFLLCMNHIVNDYKSESKSKEEIVHVCARIAYIAACFLRKNSKSKAPGLALDGMLKIVEDLSRFPKSEDEVLITHTEDDHYRFAYDLVETVLKMKNIPVMDADLLNPINFVFTDRHRNKIKELLSKKSSQLDKEIEKLTCRQGLLDYSDSNFLLCLREIKKKYQYDQKTEEGLVYISAITAYLSACFSKHMPKSNAPFLAVNHIYEIIKEENPFSNLTDKHVQIIKANDDHYRFACFLASEVLKFKDIPVSPMDSPIPDTINVTDIINDLLSKEWSQLDKMVEKLTNNGSLGYSDDKFIHCMNIIVQDYQADNKIEEFVHVCVKIAYTAAAFLMNNCRSYATLLAVNRMYEMSKDSLDNKMEAFVKDGNYDFAYDLVTAVLKIRNSSSFEVQMPDYDDSPFTIKHRYKMQEFLSNEWPHLHQIVRKFTKTCNGTAIRDNHFIDCIQQIVNDFGPEPKSEEELLFVSARAAYVAAYFLKKNHNSTAAEFTLDCIYEMKKKCVLVNDTEKKSSVIDICGEKHHFAYNLVATVMELMSTPMPDAKLQDPKMRSYKSFSKKNIKNLLTKTNCDIDNLVKKLTITDGSTNYSDDTFQCCMDKIFKKYKFEEKKSKKGFVRLCARIAYPASSFVSENKKSKAIILAVERIHEMVRNTKHF